MSVELYRHSHHVCLIFTDLLVPQHGAPLAGPAIPAFFDWVEHLACGIDLFDDRNYQLPRTLIDPRMTHGHPAMPA